ncbi:MAG: molybdenum ABC transporter ATP-binding protein [Pseudomonadota bacterium]
MSLSVSLRHALDSFQIDLAFDAQHGITVLFGRSGSGKTAIVNMVAGLMRPQHGCIRLYDTVLSDGESGRFVPSHRRRIGIVFQDGRLFPHLTVRQNLQFGAWFAPKDAPREDFDRIVEMLGIGPLLKRYPGTLSGGEKQRVAIGRAILSCPRMILADEPLSSLDEARKAEILPYFERLRDELNIPVLYVSHSPAEVARLASRVVVVDAGRIVRQGDAVDVLSDPNVTPIGARGAGAILEGLVAAHHDDGITELNVGDLSLYLPRLPRDVGSRVRIRIAASDVIIARDRPTGLSALNILPGEIEKIRSGEGPGAIVSLKTDAGAILARITRRSLAALALEEGVQCFAIAKTVSIAPEDVGLG